MSFNYDSIKLEKGMYSHGGKSFTQVLEAADPSDNYRGTALEGLDAFQRQLKRFGIKVKGTNSSTVEQFFLSPESAVLFPEFVARAIKAGMEKDEILPNIAAAVTYVDTVDYRPIAIPASAADIAAEGTALAETAIRTKANVVPLKKYGTMLTASYEALRGQKLDMFAVALGRIGASIVKKQLADAVAVLENGDTGDAPITAFSVGTSPIGGSAGTLTYAELIDFWKQFDGFTMDTMLVSPDVAVAMLTPLGAKLIPCSAVGEGKLIGLDRSCALEMITAPTVTVEQDKLISHQLERVAVSSAAGFSTVCEGAALLLNV